MFKILADMALLKGFIRSPLALPVMVFLLFSMFELFNILKLFSSLALLVNYSPFWTLIDRYFFLTPDDFLLVGDFDLFYLIY